MSGGKLAAAVEVADDDPEAIALPAPDDDSDLEDAEDDGLDEVGAEDGGEDDDSGEDAAAVAGRWRADAAAARERAARVAAEAQEKIRQAEQEAWSERQRLEAEAAEAEEQAAHWQAIAERDTVIVACEREAESLSGRLSALQAEEATLTAEADQLEARLAEFGAAREEAAQQLRNAPSIPDVGGSIAAVKDANDTLAAIGTAEAPSLERLEQVRARLAAVQGPPDGRQEIRDPGGSLVRGVTGEIPVAETGIARLRERVRVLRRQAAGLPPEGEAAMVAMRMIAEMDPPADLQPGAEATWRALALAPAARSLEEMAVGAPEEYARVRDHFLRGKPRCRSSSRPRGWTRWRRR